MDIEWFLERKKRLRVTDYAIADAIGRERSVANRVVNGKVAFDIKYADGLSRVLQVDKSEILRRAGVLSQNDLDNLSQPPSNHVENNATVVPLGETSAVRPSEDLPVYGSALGSARDVEGNAIELTSLNRAEVIHYARRPSILDGRAEAYALHVQGSSMHPALPDGELVAVSPKMPLSVGDNVVVYLRPTDPDEDDGETARGVLVKELVRRTTEYVELRQYQPQRDFRIPMNEVLRIDHVLTRKEMLS